MRALPFSMLRQRPLSPNALRHTADRRIGARSAAIGRALRPGNCAWSGPSPNQFDEVW